MQMLELSEPTKRILFLGTIVVGVILVIWVGITSLFGAPHPSQQGTTASKTPTNTYQVSPLLFGANLDISQNDQPSANQITPAQRLLQNMHVQIVRISLAEKPTQQQITQQAQYIQKIGAVPLVSLHSTFYPQALTDNTLAIQSVTRIFPNSTVYYEYGDEEDAINITADQYTQSWNQMVPKLKQLAPKAHFVGPATYEYDQNYLQSFLKQAQPLPNEVSWHEFTCAATWSQQQCLAGIRNWNQHITSARTLMSKFMPTPLPIMITAWNYAANAALTDGKSTDKTFMTTWTQNALQTLAANNVFASMQYSGVNTPTPLISQNNTLTPQGLAFRSFYEKSVATQSSSTQTALPTNTSTTALTPTSTSIPALTPTPTSTDTSSTTDTPVTAPTATSGGSVVPTPTPDPGITVVPTPYQGSSPTPTTSTGVTDPVVTPTPTTSDPVVPPTSTTAPTATPIPTPTAVPTATPKPTPTPKPKATPTPASTAHAVDGKNPTTYTVSGKTCAATLSNSTPKAVSFGSVKGTLYFQFSITCHAAWAKIVFSKPIASKALGNAKVVRTSDGKTYTCDTGGNKAVAAGQTSCYTGMVYDGPNETASAYGWYRTTGGSSSWSARLGPY